MLGLPTKHALKALLSLASLERGEFLPIAELASSADLPSSYLSKLIKHLSQQGLVITRKGPNGGVSLPRRKISLFEICEAFEDPIIFDTCLISRQDCSKDSPCSFHKEWAEQRKQLQMFLRRHRI